MALPPLPNSLPLQLLLLAVLGILGCRGSGREGLAAGSGGMAGKAPAALVRPLSMVTTGDAICTLLSDGRVTCWPDRTPPSPPASLFQKPFEPTEFEFPPTIRQLVSSGSHFCGLTQNGEVLCAWQSQPKAVPLKLTPPLGKARDLAMSERLGCVVLLSGKVRCWRYTGYRYEVEDKILPLPVRAKRIFFGDRVCITTASGRVWCWSISDPLKDAKPAELTELRGARELFFWGSQVCAQISKRLKCSIDPIDQNKKHDTKVTYPPLPATTVAASTFTQFSVYSSTPIRRGCAVLENGELWCWGTNTQGEIGDGTTDYRAALTRVPLTDVAGVFLYGESTCAWQRNGRTWCWGENNKWVPLGPSPWKQTVTMPTESPIVEWARLPGLLGKFDRLSGERSDPEEDSRPGPCSTPLWDEALCAVTEDGAIYCSRGHEAERLTGVPPAKKLYASPLHRCVIAQSGKLLCWGYNGHGQLGNGSREGSCEPQELRYIERATQTSDHCAALEDGGVKCWGDAFFGVLGQGGRPTWPSLQWPMNPAMRSEHPPSLPVRALGLNKVISLTGGVDGTCALQRNGLVICWGDQPGLGDLHRNAYGFFLSVPRAFPNLGRLRQLLWDVDYWGLTMDGNVVRWGAEDSDFLQDTENEKDWTLQQPRQIGGMNGARTLSIGNGEICVQLENGEVWCWTAAHPEVRHAVPELNGVRLLHGMKDGHCGVRGPSTLVCQGTWKYNPRPVEIPLPSPEHSGP